MPKLGAAALGGLVGAVFGVGAGCAGGGFDELSLPIEQPEKASMTATAIFSAGENTAAIAPSI